MKSLEFKYQTWVLVSVLRYSGVWWITKDARIVKVLQIKKVNLRSLDTLQNLARVADCNFQLLSW